MSLSRLVSTRANRAIMILIATSTAHAQSPRSELAARTIPITAANAQPTQQTRADLVVTPAWLAEHLHDANLVLLHVGMMEDKEHYAKAHIPGARYVDLDDISISSKNHTDSLMLEMPTPEKLRSQLATLGISDDSRIVVYFSDDDLSPTTRVMLTLDYAGLGAHSSLLDGGMNAWKTTGHSVTAQPTRVVAGKLSPLHIHPVVTNIAYVNSHLHDAGFHLIDGRAPMYFDGVQQGMKPGRKGHIVGAHNIPFTEVTDEQLRLKSPEQLATLFAKAGVGPRDTVVAYCHIGQQATAVLFAARTLGHPVLLFDGSFQEWGRRTDLPVENPSDGTKK
ncbi:MAG: sulfurtransferase [bacterium]